MHLDKTFLLYIIYIQGYIFCKILWWWWVVAAGEKKKTEGVGEKMKGKGKGEMEKGEKRLKNDLNTA